MTTLSIPQAPIPCDFLHLFTLAADEKREKVLVQNLNSRCFDEDIVQNVIICEDLTHYARTFLKRCQYEALSISQSIVTISLSPFAVLAELYRFAHGTINATTCLKNIAIIPKHVFLSIFKTGFYVLRATNKAVDSVAITTGFFVWHSVEACVRCLKDSSFTVLSSNVNTRDIVYRSIGLTILSSVLVFIPKPPIQMIALPIILGSLYATINNQFTVRECPEYYTMGHYYDGTDLKGHAIKTNNVIIKPIITGCYATTFVSKIAGVILASAGTLPFTATALPVPYLAAMVGGVSLISLVAAHFFSKVKKNSIEDTFNNYATLIGFEWTNDLKNMTWSELEEKLAEKIETKREQLKEQPEKLEVFNKRLVELTAQIETYIIDSDMPIKLISGWQANGIRNGMSYVFAGAGTLAITITTIALRIFAL